MNVDAGRRLCHPEVINAIEDQGLKQILRLLSDFIDAFEDSKMSIVEKCVKVNYLKNIHCKLSCTEKYFLLSKCKKTVCST